MDFDSQSDFYLSFPLPLSQQNSSVDEYNDSLVFHKEIAYMDFKSNESDSSRHSSTSSNGHGSDSLYAPLWESTQVSSQSGSPLEALPLDISLNDLLFNEKSKVSKPFECNTHINKFSIHNDSAQTPDHHFDLRNLECKYFNPSHKSTISFDPTYNFTNPKKPESLSYFTDSLKSHDETPTMNPLLTMKLNNQTTYSPISETIKINALLKDPKIDTISIPQSASSSTHRSECFEGQVDRLRQNLNLLRPVTCVSLIHDLEEDLLPSDSDLDLSDFEYEMKSKELSKDKLDFACASVHKNQLEYPELTMDALMERSRSGCSDKVASPTIEDKKWHSLGRWRTKLLIPFKNVETSEEKCIVTYEQVKKNNKKQLIVKILLSNYSPSHASAKSVLLEGKPENPDSYIPDEFSFLKSSRFISLTNLKKNMQISKKKSKSNDSPVQLSNSRFGECSMKPILNKMSSESRDRYYSRLNIYELAKILGLDEYDIKLTKVVEINVLDIFKKYCDFDVGYQTWIRGTNREQRIKLLNKLHKYTKEIYPEFNKFQLEIIVRRGTYSLMQSRLRRERRLMN